MKKEKEKENNEVATKRVPRVVKGLWGNNIQIEKTPKYTSQKQIIYSTIYPIILPRIF